MKKQISLQVLCAGAILISGCGGFDQDPLKGRSDNIRNGGPAPEKPIGNPPLDPDAISIVAPTFVSFEEQINRSFVINARVLEEGYTANLQIENLNEFPGAKFNPTTGSFEWAPTKGFVDASGPGVSVLKILNIRVTAAKSGALTLSREHKVEIRVFRDYKVPELAAIVPPKSSLREGEVMEIPVSYVDRDADPADRSTWSVIKINHPTNGKSIAGLVSSIQVSKASGSNSEYRAILKLDLTDVELTNSIARYAMELSLVSKYGKFSTAQNVTLDLYTSFAAPVTTWTERLEATVDQPLTYKFVISDPKLEQVLGVTGFENLPTGADINCQLIGRSVATCLLSWTPAAGSEGSSEIVAVVSGTNIDKRDTLVSVKKLYLRTIVHPKGP